MSLSVIVSAEAPADAAAVERLSERAFGPGRFARTAYRVRESAAADPALSFVARISTLLVGANRMTGIRCGAARGLLLGPLTVDPAFRSRGIGAALVKRSLDAAIGAGHRLVILVGDEAYYGRFGFVRVPAGRLAMPGPVDPARVLFRELQSGAFAEAKGTIVAWTG
ncbi:GNAT family N-acetyltransferase [Lichenifustis flavocetrariae]|uniref:N-acetyltransferase n=1 Tax=Lichenifustis flavocetrariae TaxID=2949735 RepID=A0AA41YVL6_9HYPH|nr:N-acetyltransferase [Lichenifustis flavocetrariae]MCW6508130.1 N-acetyltransferase [Lichenifustis flavocetrariae]